MTSVGTSAHLATAAYVTGCQERSLDLTKATGAEFSKANVTIAVSALGATGNGIVNVGLIDPDGLDLGAVVVKDLGQIRGGASATGGVKTITMNSLGKPGTATGARTSFHDLYEL